jgi:hypothetical protein
VFHLSGVEAINKFIGIMPKIDLFGETIGLYFGEFGEFCKSFCTVFRDFVPAQLGQIRRCSLGP